MRWAVFASLLVAGCVHPIDNETPRIGEVTRDCVIDFPGGADPGAPAAIDYADGALWLWPSGQTFVRSIEDACGDRLIIDPTAPVPLTVEESAPRSDGKRWELRPRGGFARAADAILYFDRVLVGPGIFDVESHGAGVCVIATRGQPCTRTALTFATNSAAPAQGFVPGDGFAYFPSCRRDSAFGEACVLGRVRLGEAEVGPYQWWNGAGGDWRSADQATILVRGPNAASLGHSAHLDAFLFVAADFWTGRLELRIGDAVTGKYSSPFTLAQGIQPDSFFISGGLLSRALSDGPEIALTYHTRTSAPGGGLHLVTFRFDDPGLVTDWVRER